MKIGQPEVKRVKMELIRTPTCLGEPHLWLSCASATHGRKPYSGVAESGFRFGLSSLGWTAGHSSRWGCGSNQVEGGLRVRSSAKAVCRFHLLVDTWLARVVSLSSYIWTTIFQLNFSPFSIFHIWISNLIQIYFVNKVLDHNSICILLFFWNLNTIRDQVMSAERRSVNIFTDPWKDSRISALGREFRLGFFNNPMEDSL